MKKILYISLITVLYLNLYANEKFKIPINNKFLSIENGGDKEAIDAYSDGIGLYVTGEDKSYKAMNELVFKHGEEAKKAGETLKDYVISNGSDSEKQLASFLGDSSSEPSSEPSFIIGDSCDDNDSNTTNDRYIDTNGTCHGNYIPVISSLSGWDSLDSGTTKSFSINASDAAGETLSYTYYVINVSTDNAIVSEQNIGNNSSFNLDIASPLFVSGNQYKIRIKASDGYNDAFFETNTLDVIQASNIVILANGTVTCPSATPGTTEIKDGIEYYISPNNKNVLANKIKGANGVLDNGGDDFPAQRICTTYVKDMGDIFRGTVGYALENINNFHNLSNWDTSNVTSMQAMFHHSMFNGDISNWNVSNVTNMNYMFFKSKVFQQNLNNWCVSKIKSKPAEFDTDSVFEITNHPKWGTCP
jgi:hypothetical protein